MAEKAGHRPGRSDGHQTEPSRLVARAEPSLSAMARFYLAISVVLVVIRLEEGVRDVVECIPVRRRGMSIKVRLAFPVLDQGVTVLIVGVLPQLISEPPSSLLDSMTMWLSSFTNSASDSCFRSKKTLSEIMETSRMIDVRDRPAADCSDELSDQTVTSRCSIWRIAHRFSYYEV